MTDCTGRTIKPGDYVVTSQPDWCETSKLVFAIALSDKHGNNLIAYNPDWEQAEKGWYRDGSAKVLLLTPDQVPVEIRHELDAAYAAHARK